MFLRTTLSLFATLTIAHAVSAKQEEKTPEKPQVQLAILLDTSNSMDGLISQAKSQLWKIVNELATFKRNGQLPDLEVALYEYGNSGLSKDNGFVRQVSPMTNDLDSISEKLFSLTTNGGQEYCGTVIDAAVRELDWSTSHADLKIIYIAGNEPFTQGSIDYRQACKSAIESGVIVNTIHCGNFATGEKSGWKDGALLADGSYSNIDQGKNLVAIAAPQDKEIERLGVELNKTYVAFGQAGQMGQLRQQQQDTNASNAAASDSFVNRALVKATCNYQCSSWDLVDAVRLKKVKLAELKPEQLPKEMKKLSAEQCVTFLDKKFEERTALQKQIAKLAADREQFIAKEREKLADDTEKSLDDVVISTLRSQAEAKNFVLEKP